MKRDSLYQNDVKIQNAYDNHYAGQMFWSYNGYDGIGAFNDFKDDCKKFYDAHKSEIHPIIPCRTLSSSTLRFKIKEEKGKVSLSWKAEDPAKVEYFELEKSTDGINFKPLRRLPFNENMDPNYYYNDKESGKAYYRVHLKENGGFEGTSQPFATQ